MYVIFWRIMLDLYEDFNMIMICELNDSNL